jgi:hypothetical protein
MAQTGDWQQKVAYEMKATLKADRHLVDGFQRLTYTNNSPDALNMVFYHLYFNAFQTKSMMAERNRHLPDPDGRIVPKIFNYTPDQEGWQKIKTLTQDGKPVRWDIWDTVMKVYLDHPIPSGGSSVFEMTFTSQVPLQTRRSGRDNAEGVAYSMCQWYPKMAEYDQRGWSTDPYVGREFYGVFGTFDVQIKLPAALTLGATGTLQNPEAVGHGYSNAKPTADSLTWHFKAENVHDFAWAADPEYIHEIAKTKDGLPIHILYRPDAPLSWKNASKTAVAAVERLSQQFGQYPHPQFTVAQAGDGGMEYPMMIFLAGRGLAITHEGAHQWFYSILGSDETNYPWMDEGFTSFATTEVNGKVGGNPQPSHLSAFAGILSARKMGFYEPLSTPSDWFDTNAGYSTSAYSGGEMLAEMLAYVIGRENRDKFFLAYFNRYKFKHPTPFEVEQVAESVSGMQLDWFFDQWTLRNWKSDYALKPIKAVQNGNGWDTEIVVQRKGRATMPLDIEIKLADGTSKWVNIPLSEMMGSKPVPSDWLVATPWGWTSPEYTLHLTLPQKPTFAEIDPKGMMLDDNRMNNTSKRRSALTAFMKPPQPTYFRYGQAWSLYPQYSYVLGAGIGAQYRGKTTFNDDWINSQVTLFSNLGGKNNVKNIFTLLNYDFEYQNNIAALGDNTRLSLSFDNDLGIVEDRFALTKNFTPLVRRNDTQRTLTVAFQHNDRIMENAFQGTSPQQWNSSNTLTGIVGYRAQKQNDFISAQAEAGSTINGSANTIRMILKAQKAYSVGKNALFLRFMYGLGSKDLVAQKRFRLGAADLESQWRNDAFRTLSGTSDTILQNNTFFAFSGVGPVGYLREGSSGSNERNMVAASAIFELRPKISAKILAPLSANLFSGIGYGANQDRILADLGVGLSYNLGALANLSRWAQQSDVLSSMKFAVKFPLYLSHPISSESAFKFRTLWGIEMGF